MNCNLCPRKCNINRSEKIGFCGVTDKIKIARAALHFWEEPCISGENGSGTVFFCGCNLKCVFCQNREISRGSSGKEITIFELCDIFLRLEKEKANNINLVTPTHYIDSIAKAIDYAKDKGLNVPILYNSGGYDSVAALKMLDKKIDIYLPDFKYWDNSYAKKYSNCSDYSDIAIKAIDEMVKQVGKPEFNEKGIMTKGVIVRHLSLPYLEEDSKKIIEYLYKTYGDDIYISIMNQYTPPADIKPEEIKYPVSNQQYNEIVDFALDLGVTNAFIQEDGTVSESFIPDFSSIE